jgi:very-short-patch-repair endonuclease
MNLSYLRKYVCLYDCYILDKKNRINIFKINKLMDTLLYNLGWNIMYAYYLDDKHCKTCIITDDLDKNSGYITHSIIKHYSKEYDESMFNIDMRKEYKEKKMEDLHNKVQDIIEFIVNEIKTILREKDYYQAELAKFLGTRYLEDKDWVIYTILEMCVIQGILTSYKTSSRKKYFKLLDDKKYRKIRYLERVRNISKGEILIEVILKDNNIQYKKEYTFEDLKFKGKLRYDFYLTDFKMLIEYDGKQHYEKIGYFHKTNKDFEESQTRDKLKTLYAEEKNYKLFRIRYDENVVNKIDIILKYISEPECQRMSMINLSVI